MQQERRRCVRLGAAKVDRLGAGDHAVPTHAQACQHAPLEGTFGGRAHGDRGRNCSADSGSTHEITFRHGGNIRG